MAEPTVNVDDLDPEIRKKLGIRKPRKSQFTMNDVRSRSLEILAKMSDLTQEQRRRVLEHALKVNKA